jgi:hypothetical protein
MGAEWSVVKIKDIERFCHNMTHLLKEIKASSPNSESWPVLDFGILSYQRVLNFIDRHREPISKRASLGSKREK